MGVVIQPQQGQILRENPKEDELPYIQIVGQRAPVRLGQLKIGKRNSARLIKWCNFRLNLCLVFCGRASNL